MRKTIQCIFPLEFVFYDRRSQECGLSLVPKSGLILFACVVFFLELGCGDQYRPVANPIIGPGGQPQDAHYAFVVNNNPNGAGSTTQIDVSGDTNLQVQYLGNGSSYEAFQYPVLGELFVANTAADSVSAYSLLLAGSVTTINLPQGSHPVGLASTKFGNMYVLNSDANSSCPSSGSVSVINTNTLAVSSTICVGANPTKIFQAPNGGLIFVINQGDNSVTVLDANAASVVATITTANGLGLNPKYLASTTSGAYVFIVEQGDGVNPGALDIIVTGSCTKAGCAVAASAPLGVSPNFAILDLNLNRLYVSNGGSNTVSVLDAANVHPENSPPIPLLGTASVGTDPVGVAPLPDGSSFYVANSGSNDVTAVSAKSFLPVATVALPAGAGPVWIAAEPTSSKVYVANQGASSTTIIKTVNNTVATTIAAPPQDPNCTSSCALQQPVMIVTE
jgi:YVTN family beta-propeller protein